MGSPDTPAGTTRTTSTTTITTPTPVLLAVAGVLLAIPVVALMWVSSYSRDEPRLAGFPFFIWYQFLAGSSSAPG